MALSLGELAIRHGLELRGDPETRVTRVGTLQNAGPDAVSFLANPQYRKQLAGTQAGVVILSPEFAAECPVAVLLSSNPYASYARIAAELHPGPAVVPGIRAGAVVDGSARVAPDACIAPGAVVEDGAVIGAGAYVGPNCVVGAGVEIGAGTRLVANVTLCHGVRLGARVLVHPGAVIGADGFGLAREPEGWIKVPQLGGVTIGDDVEIGANTTIDRGAIEDTVIEAGVKLDNQIQVAHNVRIGAHTVVAGCAGISGSTTIGRNCMIAGAVGIAGHLQIADGTVVTGLSMVSRSIRKPGVYSGALSVDDASRWRRNAARFRQLDTLAKRVAQLERAEGEAGQGRDGITAEDGNDGDGERNG
ncbi:UDP-3-O-(3-hydroxymyristoyl)glucosamine N-acyltransferase [Wenzhouxiangella sp. XN24]|uniref:UDP-3-O-(3-hydroxymyristoyl)glucosamine N-acyltransferase n=1 Tax=Wenzhouxiangella sp. XN24 TaxID=2713569 RepID=UPI0013EC2CF9|nr:UDP-3-O-(3-hydroxymyristoyl)glucosamine N-acyltransferase [Wenzhouxiangella sp. XN24]NGX16786.1 UDP-3-O-(3-hydroxymyristoyl)glucosamine N-acyltransferase [Wenzhouxiangella sp. XN24]